MQYNQVMAQKMTTSSYAVLALLNLKPWTGYELTQQATRSLRFAWPKSERLLYSEPKKLVSLGFATTFKDESGKRTRNVYTITDDGRTALTHWTTTRTQPPRMEVEALLRLLFAENGSLSDLSSVLSELDTDMVAHRTDVAAIMATYLDEGHPFPERTHLSVLFATFQVEISRSIERWVEFAHAEIAGWPATGGLGMTERTKALTKLLAEGTSPASMPPEKD